MKLSDLYPTTKVILGGQEKELKYTFRSIAFIEELLSEQYPDEPANVGIHILNSCQQDYMPAKTLIVLLRAGLYDNDKKEFIKLDDLIDLIETKRIDEYRRSIIKTYIDFCLNDEQQKSLTELEEKKRDLMNLIIQETQSRIVKANFSQPAPDDLVGAARLFCRLLKEKLTPSFCKKHTKN